MSRFQWKLNDDPAMGWAPWGLYLEKDDDHPPCPVRGTTYLCWSEGRELRIVRLRPGSRFECANATLPQGMLTIPDCDPIEATFGPLGLARFDIDFRWLPTHVECWLDQATHVAFPSDVDQVVASGLTPGGAVIFKRNELWTTSLPATVTDMAGISTLIIGSAQNSDSIPVNLAWRPGRVDVFFDEPGNIAPVAHLIFRDRTRQLGLILETIAPTGCQFGASGSAWKLNGQKETKSDAQTAFCYSLDGGPATLNVVAPQGRLGSAALEAGKFRVDLTEVLAARLKWPAVPPPRYSAEVHGNHVAPSDLIGNRGEWEYGPERPYLYSDTGSFAVRKSSDSGMWTPEGPDALRRGQHPAQVTADATAAYLLCDTSDALRYGVFAAMVSASGPWRPTAAITGKGTVSWLGLVDRYQVVALEAPGGAVLALRFEQGFELAPWFWFAAPFLGVAMTADPRTEWWAAANDVANAWLYRDGEFWRIEGEWHDTTTQAVSEPNLPCRLKAPFTLFWAGSGGAYRSGPILEVGSDSRYPRLRGLISNRDGIISTFGGEVAIADSSFSGTSKYHLEKLQDPPTDWPSDVKAAVAAARTPPLRSGDKSATVRWDRERDGSLELRRVAPPAHGIYVVDAAVNARAR